MPLRFVLGPVLVLCTWICLCVWFLAQLYTLLFNSCQCAWDSSSTSFCLSTQVLALYNARFRLALCWAPLALAVQQVLQQVPGPALFFCSWCFSSTSCSVPIAVCTSVNLYVPFVYNKNGPASVIHLSVLLLFVGLNIQGCLAVNIDNLVLYICCLYPRHSSSTPMPITPLLLYV